MFVAGISQLTGILSTPTISEDNTHTSILLIINFFKLPALNSKVEFKVLFLKSEKKKNIHIQ